MTCLAALVAALAGCAPAEPPRYRFPVSVQVVDERGLPLAGARIAIDGDPVEATGNSGRVEFLLLGTDGQSRRLAVEAPPGHRIQGEAERAIVLELGQPADSGRGPPRPLSVEARFVAPDQRREVLLAVALKCAGDAPCAGTPVLVDGQQVAHLDARGQAFVPLWVERGVALTAALGLEGTALRVARPQARFTPTEAGEILVFARTTERLDSPAHAAAGPAKTGRPTGSTTRLSSKVRASGAKGSQGVRAGSGGRAPERRLGDDRVRSRATLREAPSERAATLANTLPTDPAPAVDDAIRCTRIVAGRKPLDAHCVQALEAVDRSEADAYVSARKALLADAKRRSAWQSVARNAEALLRVGHLANQPELYLVRGQALVKLGDYAAGISTLEEARQRAPQWSNSLRGARVLSTHEALAFAWTRLARQGGADAARAREKALHHWGRVELMATEQNKEETARKALDEMRRLEAQ